MSARRLELLCIAALIALWALFFWRILTPIDEDKASFTQGDFSGQFFAFAAYQYDRWTDGEVPLWNPHNNGGLPFIADTQAAVFYPPRLLTLALARLSGGWTYAALQYEVVAHVLALTLTAYLLARRLTGSPFAGVIAALILGYGGFMTGYPPLQLAILEAAAWVPLAVLGVVTATDEARPMRYPPLLWTGFALGLSWLAGHPQTSFFATLLLVGLYGWRTLERRASVGRFVIGTALFGGIALGLAAVQLFPGLEYLARTTRVDFGYDAKANGFPIGDVVQMLVPGVISQWSPLYIGLTGLILTAVGIWRRGPAVRFWIVVAGIALLWSFGANSAVFPALYNLVPGLRFFRGQERAAFLLTFALALLAAYGAAALARWDAERDHGAGLRLRLAVNRLLTALLAFGALCFVALIGAPAAYGLAFNRIVLAIGAAAIAYLVIVQMTTRARTALPVIAIVGVLALELFTVGLNFDAVYDPVPPEDQVSVTPPPLIAAALGDSNALPGARVDGRRGLLDNAASLYRIDDIRGISPLWLAQPHAVIEGTTPVERAWEVFAVDRVFSDWAELTVPSAIIASGNDRFGPVNLHRLADPRPFALVLHDLWVAASADEAIDVLRRETVDLRRTAIVEIPLAIDPGEPTPAQVTRFDPEHITITFDAAARGLLTVALPYYPGWEATLDGAPIMTVRTYGALTGIQVPAGSHTLDLVYNPLSYRLGLIVSGVALAGLLLAALIISVGQMRTTQHDRSA